MTLTSFQRGTVFATRHGDGNAPRVLALHGWGRDRSDFDAVLAGTDGYAVDLPGFGHSPPPEEPWTARDYSERVVAPIVAEFPGPVVVVAHSYGGRVAVHLAAAHPELVRALVLVAVPLLRPAVRARPRLRYRALRALHRIGLLPDAAMERARRRHGSADYRSASPLMRQVLVHAVNESYETQLAAVACPAELLWGEDDTAVPVAVAEQARELLPGAELTVVPGAGHLLPVTHPGAVRAALGKHLS